MDKILSLGISPGPPKKYPRSTSVKAWGCPRHPLFINKKHRVIFQCAIFLLLHALCVILGASLFSVVCVWFSINKDPIILLFVLERDTLHLISSLVLLLIIHESDFKEVDWCWKSREKILRALLDANGSFIDRGIYFSMTC
jgi:hypothetical protein